MDIMRAQIEAASKSLRAMFPEAIIIGIDFEAKDHISGTREMSWSVFISGVGEDCVLEDAPELADAVVAAMRKATKQQMQRQKGIMARVRAKATSILSRINLN